MKEIYASQTQGRAGHLKDESSTIRQVLNWEGREPRESLLRAFARRVSVRVTAAILALIGYEPAKVGEVGEYRVALPMGSGVNILPNTSTQITSRPQNVAFRPERIVIGGDPGDWVVNDIKVGRRSQLAQSGDVPGEMFAYDATDTSVSMETVQVAMDFTMVVAYVGGRSDGAPFMCSVIGTAIT